MFESLGLETLLSARRPVPEFHDVAAPALQGYRGPERRSATSLAMRRMAQMLDAIDYGMLLVSDERRLLHANVGARRELDAQHPLQVLGGLVEAQAVVDAAGLQAALHDAAARGLRRLLRLGSGERAMAVAVVPMPPLGADQRRAVLLVLGKRRMCEELTVDWFARSHHLTSAETQVLKRLTQDLSPQQIAVAAGVRLATVRSQISSIRVKTGTESIRALLRQLALLPPLVSALAGLAPR